MPLPVLFTGSISLSIASLRMAMDQPVMPGKLILWTLLMLSLVSWAVIVSKIMSFRRFRKSDILFTKRLRSSRATLELFEEGWEDPNSLHHEIYLNGARETAFQLLGSREPDPSIHNRIKKAGKLSGKQIESIRRAFQRGLRSTSRRLEVGLSVLRITAIAAPLIGILGMVWMLMRGFDAAKTFEEVSPWISGSLFYLAFALLVCIPAFIGLLVFRAVLKDRKQELSDYTGEITRLFERSFAEPKKTLPPNAPQDDTNAASEQNPARKEFHSIRKAMEKEAAKLPPQDLEAMTVLKPQNEVLINPIARQTSTAGQNYVPTFE